MKKINYTLLLLVFAGFGQLKAQKHDAVWPFGIHEFPVPTLYGNASVQFQNDTAAVVAHTWNLNFGLAAGAFSDADGNLLFVTNGCVVVDALGDTLKTASGATGVVAEAGTAALYCTDVGLPVPQGVVFLPKPGSEDEVMMLTMGVHYDPQDKWLYGPMFAYTITDNSGQKVLSEVPETLPNASNPESYALVRQGNGRDWWLLAPLRKSNGYALYAITPEGIVWAGQQNLGPAGDCLRPGACVFSPDGAKFARTQNCQTVVFDFDRCSGVLSEPVVFERPDYVFGGGGVVFSPDASRVYVSEQLAILSADLNAGQTQLDTVVLSDSTVGVSIGRMQAGPNGVVYANSTHRSRFLASFVPTISGVDLQYNAKAVPLGKTNAMSLPQFPNYRLYDLPGSPCDSLGINPVSTMPNAALRFFPNPASNTLFFESPNGISISSLYISDLLGRVVLNQISPSGTVDISQLAQGTYMVYACFNTSQPCVVEKLVVVRVP